MKPYLLIIIIEYFNGGQGHYMIPMATSDECAQRANFTQVQPEMKPFLVADRVSIECVPNDDGVEKPQHFVLKQHHEKAR